MIVLLIVLFVVMYSSWCKLWSWRLCILPRKQWMCEVSTHCTATWLCVPLFSGVSVHMYVCMAIVPIVPLVHLISWNACAPCTPCKACFSTSPFLFLGGACWLLSGWPGASSPAPSHHLNCSVITVTCLPLSLLSASWCHLPPHRICPLTDSTKSKNDAWLAIATSLYFHFSVSWSLYVIHRTLDMWLNISVY